MNSQPVSAFFVYGTLKKSYLRGGLWPRKPLRIVAAAIQADLFDLGPYPGAVKGKDWLLGEIWEFNPYDMEPTIEELDIVEGYDVARANNEYTRQIVTAEYAGSESQPEQMCAYAYFISQPKRVAAARRIKPTIEFLGRSVSAWPDAGSRVPTSFAEE